MSAAIVNPEYWFSASRGLAGTQLEADGMVAVDWLEQAVQQFPDSSEAPLRLAWLHIEDGNVAEAEKLLAYVEAQDPFDWRPRWYRGRGLLAQKKYREAQDAFHWIYSELPGELACADDAQ